MAVLTFTRLETHPTATTNLNAIINGNWAIIEALFSPDTPDTAPQFGAVGTALAGQGGLTEITYAASITVELKTSKLWNACDLTGGLAVDFNDYAKGRFRFLILATDGSSRNLTWPGDAVWSGDALTSMAGNTVAIVLAVSRGTDETGLRLVQLAGGSGGGGGGVQTWIDPGDFAGVAVDTRGKPGDLVLEGSELYCKLSDDIGGGVPKWVHWPVSTAD